MTLLQIQGGGTYVDYGFYSKMGSFEETIKTAFTEVLGAIGNLGDTASAIGAIAATLYVTFRILEHLARAEAVEVMPLFRPFVLGFFVLHFTIITGFLNAAVKPVESVTQGMVDMQTTRIQQIESLRDAKMKEHMKQMDQKLDDMSLWHPGQYIMLMIEKQRGYLQEGLDMVLKNFFYAIFLAARLVVLTARAFFLLILTIVGPLSFAIAIFSGFRDSYLLWIARYVQISLWLPLANILGTITSYMQAKVISLQYLELTNNVPDEARSGSLIYIVFMIIATISYLTIPTIATFIISSSGVGNAMQRVSSVTTAMVAGAMNSSTHRGVVSGVQSVGSAVGAAGGMAYSGAAMGVGASIYAARAGAAGYRYVRNISKGQD